MSEWSHVYKNLPNLYEAVLVYDGQEMFVAYRIKYGTASGWSLPGTEEEVDIGENQFWMPLPKAPDHIGDVNKKD